MMRIRMIATDLDRTLLDPEGNITAYTQRVLTRCRERGILLAFATARSARSCARFAKIVPLDAMVQNGGAIASVGGEVVYRAIVARETLNRLLALCASSHGGGYVTADTGEKFLVNKPVDDTDPNWADFIPAQHVDFTKGLNCGAYKIVAELSSEAEAREIAGRFADIRMTPYSGEGWYHFASHEADKWKGVEAVARHAGIDPSEIAAFGDDFSDIEMIRNSGFGVAVENAIAEVKAAARHVCASNARDGVAAWLEENAL